MSLHSLVIVSAVANQDYPMIHLIIFLRAVQILLCNNSFAIRLKHRSGVNRNPYWLFEELLSYLIIGHFIMLYHVDVFEVILFGLLAFLGVVRIPVRILASQHNPVLLGILIGFIHPPTGTSEVVLITIH